MRSLLVLSCMLLSSAALSADWSCQNSDVEVRCEKNVCEASESFTPISIHTSGSGLTEVCAYSGCWRGNAKYSTTEHYTVISAKGLQWDGTTENPADILIVIDQKDSIGFLKGGGFAMPIQCSKTN